MVNEFYTNERNVQILIYLLKSHGIKKIISSPGTTNITFAVSMRHDPFFEIYSAPDERSAAYMACGLSAESGEPVVLTCTGATASRNYMPGLTEAYYRKLPILAVTSTQRSCVVGHGWAQVIDRSQLPHDIALCSVQLPSVLDSIGEWGCAIDANRAILELKHRGGGPVHINLETNYSRDFSIREIPPAPVIHRHTVEDEWPDFPDKGKIAIFVGAHLPWSKSAVEAINAFCASHDAVVFCDQTSNYWGKYRCDYALVGAQEQFNSTNTQADLLIHIGEISGSSDLGVIAKSAEVWRVSPDGRIQDTFKKLSRVFEMREEIFFRRYSEKKRSVLNGRYLTLCQDNLSLIRDRVAELDLPLSNLYIAREISPLLPENSILHLGILNSLRSWDLLGKCKIGAGFSNTGGFGIDGSLSSLLGGALASPEVLHFCVLGDLAFFYDMNALGNRHVGKNLRILLINNGNGTEFRNYNHPGAAFKGSVAGDMVAADGHYGRKSSVLVKHYAEDLGFEYFQAKDKESFNTQITKFTQMGNIKKSIIFEVFTDSEDESDALFKIRNAVEPNMKGLRDVAKRILPANLRNVIAQIINQ